MARELEATAQDACELTAAGQDEEEKETLTGRVSAPGPPQCSSSPVSTRTSEVAAALPKCTSGPKMAAPGLQPSCPTSSGRKRKGKEKGAAPRLHTPASADAHWLEVRHRVSSSYRRAWDVKSLFKWPHGQLKAGDSFLKSRVCALYVGGNRGTEREVTCPCKL